MDETFDVITVGGALAGSSATTRRCHPTGSKRERRRLRAMFTADPMTSPLITAFIGAWVLPAAPYSDDAWNALAA